MRDPEKHLGYKFNPAAFNYNIAAVAQRPGMADILRHAASQWKGDQPPSHARFDFG
jgi:hypothetical protein